MAVQAGQLLLNRRRLTLQPGVTTVDTLLQQTNLNFDPDPELDGADPPNAVASRVMVIPMSPLPEWDTIIHDEPKLGAGDTVEVRFNNTDEQAHTINVLFWNPHTRVCPVSADPYAGGEGCEQCDFVAIESAASNQS